ncbi:hypothetical protein IE53DRAFT_390660 [Violaceomyces palustris]|uniref:Uncharacterized protein n=1 Tax=Violaceomyces palustris TaxID=1673888 RepID=A0ACD0NN39_9BASI|nr:hypothetical protein IE53DRAFT_390660 [Violaceomyces palustris]
MATPIGFFGLKLVPGEVHRMDVLRDFKITNVSYSDVPKGQARTVLKVHYTNQPDFQQEEEDDVEEEEEEEKSYTLCTLIPEKVEQAVVNLQFCEEEEVGFSITGDNAVDLIGNYVAPPDYYDQDPDSDDEEALYGSDDDSEDFDDDDMIEIEDGDEEDEARFEEIKEDSEPKKKSKAIESAPSKEKKRTAAQMDQEDDADTSMATAEQEQEEQEDQEASKLTKNQRKRLNKKIKTTEEETAAAASSSPAKSEKANNTKPKAETTTTSAAKADAKPAAQTEKKKAVEKKEAAAPKLQKTKLPSGLVIEDKKVGTGPTAKPGQKVGMRYVGKLQSGKVFDQCVKGKPFYFKLGKGEVIKGWDEGVKGMQVGSERRLTCPPKLAYGNQKIPGIPPNSTLIFDVKLVEIK